ncbi:tripeptidyl-peptidase [Akanthomyces lecanii RCEF 1005]|uniref:tripeptidyl-peptidase II n=1 Tax=Akanthomyces lecanii RCEF 1005 TaxID=1081108 RepID=A0A168KQR8_CORDF|nr:tripeptidyl-peptidase [Akanthomyces lecanii RCEF 1005]
MKLVTGIFVLLLAGACATGLPNYKRKSLIQEPSEWKRIRRAYPNELVDVSIGLVQHGFASLEQRLLQVSTPTHPEYGKHLSTRQIQKLLRPKPDHFRSVLEWLSESGGLMARNVSKSSAGDWLEISMPIKSLEHLLQTEYWIFEHIPSGTIAVRTLEWSLPTHLLDVVEVIAPTNVFILPTAQLKYGAPAPLWETEGRVPTHEELVEEDWLDRGHLDIPAEDALSANPTPAEACNRLAISSLCLRVLYGTWGYSPRISAASRKNSMGMVNFLGQVANRSDVALYLARYRPDAAAAHAEAAFSVELVSGGDDQQTPNTPQQNKDQKGYEGALDAQTMLGISWPTPLVMYNVGGKPPFRPLSMHTKNTNEPYLAWLRHMQSVENPPSVISISYAEDEKLVPPEYARRVCAEFAQLAARGVSVLVASGDYGVGRTKQCVTLDEKRRRFMPSFPASCPYVTAVGATRFIEPEMVAFDARSSYASGGGFSDVFAQPAYQRQAVESYLAELDRRVEEESGQEDYRGLFNRTGRAYPDIAAMGYHFSVLWGAVAHLQDGTSASTPTVAAIIGLVNDALIDAGRPPLGFLNPWLYSAGASAFRDVKVGSNMGCNTSGFPATEGWDPATGLGTPWFPKLKEVALMSRFRATRPWYYLPGI